MAHRERSQGIALQWYENKSPITWSWLVLTHIGPCHDSCLPFQLRAAGSWVPRSTALEAHDQRQQRRGEDPDRVVEDVQPRHFTAGAEPMLQRYVRGLQAQLVIVEQILKLVQVGVPNMLCDSKPSSSLRHNAWGGEGVTETSKLPSNWND